MKKGLSWMLTLVLLLSVLAGCGSKASTKDDGTTNNTTGESYKIGVVQISEHVALDAAYNGFIDGLKEAGYEEGKNITIDYNNAQGEQANCTTIAQKLINNKEDLILAIGTPAAQACAAQTEDIPILITAVTDPAYSGLVDSNEIPGNNITGTSDLTPVVEQIKLLKNILPDAKKVAVLYCSSEDNSIFQAEIAKKEIESLGMDYVEKTVSNSNEITSVVESLIGKVDAIYAPTDNIIAENMAAVAAVANKNNLPCIVGEEGMVTQGGLATKGLDYYNLGKQTAAMAVKILTKEAEPKDMPIEYIEQLTFKVNEEVAKELGITIPDDVLGDK